MIESQARNYSLILRVASGDFPSGSTYLRLKRYPYSIFTATLGENQDTSKKKIESYKKVRELSFLAGPGGRGNVSQNITRKIDPLSTCCLAK